MLLKQRNSSTAQRFPAPGGRQETPRRFKSQFLQPLPLQLSSGWGGGRCPFVQSINATEAVVLSATVGEKIKGREEYKQNEPPSHFLIVHNDLILLYMRKI